MATFLGKNFRVGASSNNIDLAIGPVRMVIQCFSPEPANCGAGTDEFHPVRGS
jgi:hypothetical protein